MSAALIGALGSIGASLIGAHAQSSATSNMNAFNERMYQLYKDPRSSARNLRAAGLNPAFAMQQIAQGSLETPVQSQPQETSALAEMGANAANAYLSGSQSDMLKSQQRNQDIQNTFEQQKQMLNIQEMAERVLGYKYDNYVKEQSKDMQVNIIKQQEQQMYTKTYADNLLASQSEWDLASKALFNRIGLPQQFEKMRYDIANAAASLNYQLKVNKWYDRFSKAQVDSLYNNAAAALIQAHAAYTNAQTNASLAPSQIGLNKSQSRLNDTNTINTSWQTSKDTQLFPIVKQSLKLGVDEKQQEWDFNNASKFNNFFHRSFSFIRSHSPVNFSMGMQ